MGNILSKLPFSPMRCICCLSNKIKPGPFNKNIFFCCQDCGFLFKAISESHEQGTHLVKHYENIDPHETVAYSKQAFFNLALKHLPSPGNKNKSILDVGCGYGYFLALADKRGWQTSGVEIAGEAVRRSREIAVGSNIFHGTLKQASFPDDSFDAITLWDVLVFTENPAEDLRECFRILKDRGKIGIRVRNITFQKMAYRLFAPFKGIAARMSLKRPYVFHRYCYSGKSVQQLLLRLGFTNIQSSNSPLTQGYRHTHIKGLIQIGKHFINVGSKIAFFLSCGRWLIGPSLLIWAEKPEKKLKDEPDFSG